MTTPADTIRTFYATVDDPARTGDDLEIVEEPATLFGSIANRGASDIHAAVPSGTLDDDR